MRKKSCDLNSCFLCRNCLPEWKQLVDLRKETRGYRKGERIFSEGEAVTGMRFLNSGFVKVHKSWREPKELIIRFSGPGELVGHRALPGASSYPVSATAVTDASICFIPGEFFEESLQSNQGLVYQLMRLFSKELQTAEIKMRDLVHMEVKSRISKSLFEMVAIFGKDEKGFLNVPISRQDIAAYSGTIYETVFRFFRELETRKIIGTEGKRLQIRKSKLLQAYISVSE